MKKVTGILLAALMVFGLTACGGGGGEPDNPRVGTYEGVSVSMMGIELGTEEVFEKGVTLELKNKGKCTLTVDGDGGSGKWTLEGDTIHITGGGADEYGTFTSETELVLENLQGSGVDIKFAKAA